MTKIRDILDVPIPQKPSIFCNTITLEVDAFEFARTMLDMIILASSDDNCDVSTRREAIHMTAFYGSGALEANCSKT